MEAFLAWLKGSVLGIIILGAVGSLLALSVLALLRPLTKRFGRMFRNILPEKVRQMLRLLERPLVEEAERALSRGEIFTLSRVVYRALWAIIWFAQFALFMLAAAVYSTSDSLSRLTVLALVTVGFVSFIMSMRRVTAVRHLSGALSRCQRQMTFGNGGRDDEEAPAANSDAMGGATRGTSPLSLAAIAKELRPPRDLVAAELLAAAFANARFALVAVRNEGPRNIAGLLPEIWFAEERYSDLGMWYSESEAQLLRLTPEGIPLGVGAERLLVVAVIFPEITRAAGGGRLWYAVTSRNSVASYFDQVQVVANGQALGERASLRVRFRAEGVDQSISIRLTSTPDGEPVIKSEF